MNAICFRSYIDSFIIINKLRLGDDGVVVVGIREDEDFSINVVVVVAVVFFFFFLRDRKALEF